MKRAEKSYVIFGIGKFGRSVAEELTAAGMHVLAIDKDEDKVTAVADTVTMAVTGDVTDPKDMDGLGLSNFDAAIVATTGDLSAGVMAVILAKEAGIPYVLVKASDEIQSKVFTRLGADRVIIPEKESAARTAPHPPAGELYGCGGSVQPHPAGGTGRSGRLDGQNTASAGPAQ